MSFRRGVGGEVSKGEVQKAFPEIILTKRHEPNDIALTEMKNDESDRKFIIGRRDLIDLPDFGIQNISAKIDTGAYTSALHAHSIRIIENKLIFKLEHLKGESEIEAHDFSERLIKNSFGVTEKRFVIKTRVLIFNKIFETEFSLCDRSEMKHPVLLGRKFLKDQFIVDVSRFNLSYKQKRKLERKNLA